MVLRNWYNMALPFATGVAVDGMMKTTSGSVYSAGASSYQSATYSSLKPTGLSASYGSGSMVIGTGDKEPEIDDYKLSGRVITEFAATSKFTSRIENGKVTWTAVYTITNTGSSAFTIREIGKCSYAYSGNGSSSQTVMIERSLLAEPLTIPAGGVGQLTHEISIPIPEGFD